MMAELTTVLPPRQRPCKTSIGALPSVSWAPMSLYSRAREGKARSENCSVGTDGPSSTTATSGARSTSARAAEEPAAPDPITT